jgi:hypothetical protein
VSNNKGGFFLSGCVFWIVAAIVIALVVASPVVLPIVNSVEDNAAARRAKEQADRAQAETARIQAEAQADVLRMYTEAGISAIETDRRHAHPLAWIAESLTSILIVLSVLSALVLLTISIIWYQDPETGQRIINSLLPKNNHNTP